MRTLITCGVILAACLFCMYCAGGCGPDKHLIFSNVAERGASLEAQHLAKVDLQFYWRARIRLAENEIVRRLWRLDENIYALTSANRLVALDAARGTYKWSYQVARRINKVFSPCHADEVEILKPDPDSPIKTFKAVLINTLSYALLINRDTGKLVRKLDFKFTANTSGSSDGEHFYVASERGWYYAVNLSNGFCRWTMSTKKTITARPTIFGKKLFVASHDGKLYVINPGRSKDRLLWNQLTDAPLSADFFVDARGCFVPGQDYRLHAYDNLTGEELWRFVARGPMRQPVQVGRETVFQVAFGDRFYAVNLANGRKRWDLKNGRIVLGSVKINKNPYVFVLTTGKRLLIVHEILGKVEKSLLMTGLDLFVPSATKPVIYAATTNGKIVCIRPVSAGHLTPKMLKDSPGN